MEFCPRENAHSPKHESLVQHHKLDLTLASVYPETIDWHYQPIVEINLI